MPNAPVVLQVLPSLVTGGVERGTIEMAQAIAEAGGTALVASAGGPLVAALERAGGRHVELPLMTKDPLNVWLNAGRLDARDPGGRRRHRPCPLARARLVRLDRVAADGRAFRDHVSRRLWRGRARQAPLQLRDGPGRARHRDQPLYSGPCHGAAPRRPGPHPHHSTRRRSGAVRPGRGRRRAGGAAGAILAAARGHARDRIARPADALEGAVRAAARRWRGWTGRISAACWWGPNRDGRDSRRS